MADPISLTMIAATAIGGGIQAYGAYSGGQAQKAYYQYQAGIANQQAQIARLKATRDFSAGELEAQKYGIKTAQVLGGTIARAGAGNIGPTTGSTAAVYMSQRAAGLTEQATARQTAAERAYGEDVEAAAKVASAGALGFAGAHTAGDISAIGSVVSTVGSVAGKWYDVSKLGAAGAGGGGPLDILAGAQTGPLATLPTPTQQQPSSSAWQG
jgi:hypothetical protein